MSVRVAVVLGIWMVQTWWWDAGSLPGWWLDVAAGATVLWTFPGAWMASWLTGGAARTLVVRGMTVR